MYLSIPKRGVTSYLAVYWTNFVNGSQMNPNNKYSRCGSGKAKNNNIIYNTIMDIDQSHIPTVPSGVANSWCNSWLL